MDLEVSGAVLPRTAGSRSWGPETARPMPIHECPWHFGGGRTRNRACDGHAADSACRWRACGCATASEARMPIRAPWTWLGATPHLGMPRSASGRMEPDSPILPSAAGSLPASSPSGKGVGPMRPWTLVIIGVALTAATVRAFLAPFPGIGGNPVLDLIAYHDPGLTHGDPRLVLRGTGHRLAARRQRLPLGLEGLARGNRRTRVGASLPSLIALFIGLPPFSSGKFPGRVAPGGNRGHMGPAAGVDEHRDWQAIAAGRAPMRDSVLTSL